MDLNLLKKNLCESFCRDIAVKQLSDHTVLMSLPTTDRDGDGFSVYLQETTPGFRLSDGGNTLMRLSYDADIKMLLKGTRKSVFDLILSESGVYEEDGEIYKDIAPQQLIPELFNITKAMTRVSDLSFKKGLYWQ
jgi:hypothetical protein